MFTKSLSLLLAAMPFALAISAPAPADDVRVRQLESELRSLQRELDAQARRIDELERIARNRSPPRAPVSARERADSSPAWLVSTNWDRLRPGMKEVDVIALLGRPTSIRTDSDGKIRLLFYAMEIGPTVILSGNVQLGDAGVMEINKPALR